jgi:hypothetical protein
VGAGLTGPAAAAVELAVAGAFGGGGGALLAPSASGGSLVEASPTPAALDT